MVLTMESPMIKSINRALKNIKNLVIRVKDDKCAYLLSKVGMVL